MPRSALRIALPLLLGLVGCSALAPSESAPDPTTVASADQTVGICYTRTASTPEQVLASAKLSCATGTTPHLLEERWNLNLCPVLTPVRANFSCTAP